MPEESVDIIIDRIVGGTHADKDIQKLRQMFRGGAVANGARSVAIKRDANGATITTGDGNTILNIVFQADGLRIGEKIYREGGAEELKSLLQEFLQPKVSIDWQKISRTLLKKQLQLTTNPLTHKQDISYQVEQVYVPLGLLERKKQPRREGDVKSEHGSDRVSRNNTEVEPEPEITKRFEHEEFLTQVLSQGKSSKSQGKRIAIVGEPGAGKTTLLQQIASWISDNIDGSIAIWVSLADLKQEDLETYLETRWLKSMARNAGLADVSIAVKQSFATQVQQGQVWLLMDGLDEMHLNGSPLSAIEMQIKGGGWLQQMRIVMTCRSNLWDGNRNGLTTFDTYRTLEFAYPQQVEAFIEKWFAPQGKVSISLGKRLCKELKEPGMERIRDLVKNPLRLTLQCFSWFLHQGKLPKTQAALYESFVIQIYKWKQKQFPTTPEQQRQLNEKLGALSKAAIDDRGEREQGRFRFSDKFVNMFLDEQISEKEGNFLDLALRVGWLNRVDMDTNGESIYAFFHPTFEEYFAALNIENEKFFLNHLPWNINSPRASYRVFEKQWRQVFLFWFGRGDLDKQRKEALIKRLMTFKDGCVGIYTDRAFLLAALGIAEFKDCDRADEIIDRLVQWKFPPSVVTISYALLRILVSIG
jgi:predicted NACHT family NTPase